MTTLADLAHTLPWGFHDAHLEGLSIDWLGERLTLVMRIPMTQHQDVERRAEVVVSGLFFCSIEPLAAGADLAKVPKEGLWIDAGEGPSTDAAGLPELPPGVFLHHLRVSNWNYRSIHLAGRDAQLRWLEEPAPRRTPVGALFEGDSIPDP